MLTVACVYWKGEFRGREKVYTTEWVEKLKNMVTRNLSIPHRFVCLSNVDVPCERIPLIHDWPGWWSKIELFRPGLFEDRVLYMDLDLIILNDLSMFIEQPSTFTILGKSEQFVKKGKSGLEVCHYNSSVMVFDPAAGDCLYTEFGEWAMKIYRGDQDYIADRFLNLSTFPTDWVKKLRDCPKGVPTAGMKIMLCMAGGGMPKKNVSAAKQYKWIEEIWR